MVGTCGLMSMFHGLLPGMCFPLAATPGAVPPESIRAAEEASRIFTTDEVLSPYIYVFYASFIVAFCFTPVMRFIANYYGIIDEPDNLRKMHSKPVAYLGGVAVFLGWISGLATSQFLQVHGEEASSMSHLYVNFSIVAGATIVVVLGLWDDLFSLLPWAKIGGQVFAATILLAFGIGTHCAGPIFDPINSRLALYLHWQ